MFHKDTYRLVTIVAFIAVVILVVLLFIITWNMQVANPEMHQGNLFYFLLLMILLATGALYIGHLMKVSEMKPDQEPETGDAEPVQITGEGATKKDLDELIVTSYETDMDKIAELIIPQRDPKEGIESFAEKILSNLAKHFEVVLGVIYLKKDDMQEFSPVSTYAWASGKPPAAFSVGDGLNGQAVKIKRIMKISEIPEGYIQIASGLGEGSPRNLVLIPLMINKEVIGLIELARFKEIDKHIEWTIKNLAKIISNSFMTMLKAGKEEK